MPDIVFNEVDHEYIREGKTLISVTQLLHKHGLAPDYAAVPEEVLERAAEKGHSIHKEIELFVKEGKEPESAEAKNVADWMKACLIKGKSEVIVGNDIVAGTYDFRDGLTGNLYDWKTTYQKDEKYWSWQLSLYDYLDGKHTDNLFVGWIRGNEMQFIPVRRHEDSEIERLLQCERDGTEFKEDPNPVALQNSYELSRLAYFEDFINNLNAKLNEVKAKKEKVMEKLLQQMRDNNVKTVETPRMRIAVKDAYVQRKVDSKRLKEEMPDVYAKYLKETKVAESITIIMKGEQKEDAQ